MNQNVRKQFWGILPAGNSDGNYRTLEKQNQMWSREKKKEYIKFSKDYTRHFKGIEEISAFQLQCLDKQSSSFITS